MSKDHVQCTLSARWKTVCCEKMNKMYVLPSSEYCKKKKCYTSSKCYQLRLDSTAHNKNLTFQWLQQDGNLLLANIKEVRKWVM